MAAPYPQIFTIGHSNHPIDRFIGMLTAHQIETLVDVRAYPRSRHNPQFNQDALADRLSQAGLAYHHMVSLGGFRKHHESPGSGAFGAYISFTKTEEFQRNIGILSDIALTKNTAVMCAEAIWSRCHRQFIADAMAKAGFAVIHILDDAHAETLERSPMLPGL